jgi:hypothetical protein
MKIPASPLVRFVSLLLSIHIRSNLGTGQVGKILGERWKALNDKQRTPYEAKAAADKKRYEDEKQAYQVRIMVPIMDPLE